jgi:hypothetical protein
MDERVTAAHSGRDQEENFCFGREKPIMRRLGGECACVRGAKKRATRNYTVQKARERSRTHKLITWESAIHAK